MAGGHSLLLSLTRPILFVGNRCVSFVGSRSNSTSVFYYWRTRNSIFYDISFFFNFFSSFSSKPIKKCLLYTIYSLQTKTTWWDTLLFIFHERTIFKLATCLFIRFRNLSLHPFRNFRNSARSVIKISKTLNFSYWFLRNFRNFRKLFELGAFFKENCFHCRVNLVEIIRILGRKRIKRIINFIKKNLLFSLRLIAESSWSNKESLIFRLLLINGYVFHKWSCAWL